LVLPIIGCWVERSSDGATGQVTGHRGEERLEAIFAADGRPELLGPGSWRCGLKPGFIVQDLPTSPARTSLGTGTVIAVRELAGQELVAVQSHRDATIRWLPYENLKRIMDARVAFARAEQRFPDSAERTALNLMAHALRTWNEATGGLERLDIDPLPHQISLVHRILSSRSTNWVIADDVGLGKTIEVGLLLGALERRQNLRRVLLVVPSGLTQQWKEELANKFDKSYRIWGRDFQVDRPDEWGLYERVIVSLDFAKPRNGEDDGTSVETSFGKLLAAGRWDLVVFDEAHRLARDEAGRTTLRYRLARALRTQTDSMILLSGTPHQGDVGKFQNLLRLVRPELEDAIEHIDVDPSFIGEVVLRNRKIDAVDVNGRFIFHGLMVRRIDIPTSEPMAILEAMLADYLQRGYRAGNRVGGSTGRAIGFVMTIYRKLASSSVYALHAALSRRKQKLLGQSPGQTGASPPEADADDETDNLAEMEVRETERQFFDNEMQLLDRLLSQAESCFLADLKFTELRKLASEMVRQQHKKLLIFTEYRSTQFYLAQRFERLWGKAPAQINGGMSLDEKRAAIRAFEGDADLLISTEAGGEGLNLQRGCHVMVNYDLPWNPARLSQRIGRLYRYGQDKQVVVVNFTAQDTIDNRIISSVLARLDVLVAQMASVSDEFQDDVYRSEVLGDLLDRLDIAALLEDAGSGVVPRSQQRIDEALRNAQRARDLQEDILASASRTDSEAWLRLGAFTTQDLARFILRAAPKLGIEAEPREGTIEHLRLRLPDSLRGRFPEYGRRQVLDLRTSRNESSHGLGDIVDFASPLVRFLVAETTSESFGGSFGVAAADPVLGGWDAIVGVLAHYQSEQGEARGVSLLAAGVKEGQTTVDNRILRSLFGHSIGSGVSEGAEISSRLARFDTIVDPLEVAAAESGAGFVSQLFAAGAIEVKG
jgi:superfamily II DNA or RNA helicase